MTLILGSDEVAYKHPGPRHSIRVNLVSPERIKGRDERDGQLLSMRKGNLESWQGEKVSADSSDVKIEIESLCMNDSGSNLGVTNP